MRYLFSLLIILLAISAIAANNYLLPKQWHYLEQILNNRVSQKSKKMKIELQEAEKFIKFLNELNDKTENLIKLQKTYLRQH